MNLEKLNGLYLKFYFTKNKNLPTLLKNDGSVVVLYETVESSKYKGTIIGSDRETDNETPMYSIWVGGEKIMSGYGLLPTSLDDMQAIISNMHTKINSCVTQSYADSNLVLRDAEGTDYEQTVSCYFNSEDGSLVTDGSMKLDTRSDVSSTYFVDNKLIDEDTPVYVKHDSMYYYIKAIYDKLSAPVITVSNMSYNITYVDNKYSVDNKIISTSVSLSQTDTIVPLPLYSVIKALSMTYTINNLNIGKKYNGNIRIKEYDNNGNEVIPSSYDFSYDFSCDNVTDQTVALTLDLSANDVYVKTFIENQHTLGAVITLRENVTNVEVLSNQNFPKIRFSSYDTPLAYIMKTTGRTGLTPHVMYKINNDSLFYDYDLSLENDSDELFNESPYDRLYILVKNTYQINELYVKIFYKNEHDAVKNYNNMTDIAYRYNYPFKYTNATSGIEATYNAYGINVEDIMNDEIPGNVDRIVFKAVIGPNDVNSSETPTTFAHNNWEYNAAYPTSLSEYNYNNTFSWTINSQTDKYNYNSNVTPIYDPVVLSMANPIDRPILSVLNDSTYTGKPANYYGDEMTASEIRTINSIGQYFRLNKNITDFDKFRYFVNLVEFSTYTEMFMECTNLKTIILPYLNKTKGQASMQAKMFYNCTSLEYVGMQDFITHIGANAFNGCTNLKYIDLTHIQGLYDYVFKDCTSLERINLSKLGDIYNGDIKFETSIRGVFDGCTRLKSVVMPIAGANKHDLTEIGKEYFQNCSRLTTISIPSSVEDIKEKAFNGCTTLNNIKFNDTTALKNIGNYAFQNCATLSKNYKDIDTNVLKIPSSVENIGVGAFYGCTKLEQIALPTNTNFTGINASVFEGCTKLSELVVPDQIKSIGSSACSGCSSLTYISIESNVENIQDNAFSGCSQLSEIHCNRLQAPDLGTNVFSGVDYNNVKLYIPSNSSGYENWPGYTGTNTGANSISSLIDAIITENESTNTATNSTTNNIANTEAETTETTSTNTTTNSISYDEYESDETTSTNTSTNTVTNDIVTTEEDTTETSLTNTTTNTVTNDVVTTEEDTTETSLTNTTTNTTTNATIDAGW